MTVKTALRADRLGNQLIATTLKDGPVASGANEKAVRYLERMLQLEGFNPGVRDNKFTSRTAEALRQFQAARGLPVTGELDARTFAHLKAVQTRVRKHAKQPVYGTGQKDKFIASAERRLSKLGYDTGTADGIYDAKTAEAIEAFKADQKNLGKSGLAGKKTLEALKKEPARLEHSPYRGRATKNLGQHRRLDTATAQAAAKTAVDGTAGLGLGDRGRAVKNVQAHLRAAGFDPKRTDGVMDERTVGALEAFQRKAGLPADGRVTPRTWSRLQKSILLAKSGTSPAQRLGEKSAAVLQSERLLRQLGLNTGKVDGLFTRQTLKASRAFERRHKGAGRGGAIDTRQLAMMKRESKGVTVSQLHRLMPSLPMSKARAYLPYLNKAMAEGHINTPKRKAAFLAQLAHESGQLKYFEEIASGAAYEGRTDLGNTHPGDGVRYKGRGPIQLTGRANYRAAGKALHLPLEAHPKMVATKKVGFRVAVWFWTGHGLNGLADRGQFREITRRINGGYNGLSDRIAYYRKALNILK